MSLDRFKVGQIYRRTTDIHAHYGGQRQGGISTPEAGSEIFVFTGRTGYDFGYSDGWNADGVFEYTGEGQLGDMSFVRGNKAIRDQAAVGREILLFEAEKVKGLYRFCGTFGCAGWDIRDARDRSGKTRKAIVFHLLPIGDPAPELEIDESPPPRLHLADLRAAALKAASVGKVNSRESKKNFYARAKAVKDYVLARAGGICELCKKAAPFLRPNGEPYLEPHHSRRLSDGGPDHPRWVGAICPTCHRNIHYGKEGEILNAKLEEALALIEPE